MSNFYKTAFTLIELLVVIAIIGILSGLIVVTMSGVTAKANMAKSQVFSNSLRNALMLNLVSEWKLDGNANDSWGSNNGTPSGSPAISSNCVYGSCYSFDGSDDYINFGDTGDYFDTVFSNSFTVSLWFKTGTTPSDWVSHLIAKGNGALPYFSIDIAGTQYGSSYSKVVIRHNNDADLGYSNGRYTDNNWHQVTVTRDASGNSVKLYIDGIFDKTFGNLVYSGFSTGLMLGSCNLDRKFTGNIDEVRIYNAVMPTSQIKEQYYAGLNNLLITGSVSKNEYFSRINNYASN